MLILLFTDAKVPKPLTTELMQPHSTAATVAGRLQSGSSTFNLVFCITTV